MNVELMEALKFWIPTIVSIYAMFQFYRLNRAKKEADVKLARAEEDLKLAQAGKLDIESDTMTFDIMKETIVFLRDEVIRLRELVVAEQNRAMETEKELKDLKLEFKCEIKKLMDANKVLNRQVSRFHQLMKDLHGGVVSLIQQLKCLDPDIVPVYDPPDLKEIFEDGLG